MALVPDQKFSTFQSGGDLAVDDIVVGLRAGINTRFVYTGELPTGVIVPIIQGGTGANNASDARTNLGLGTISTQNANAIAITGGTISGVTLTSATWNGNVISPTYGGTGVNNGTNTLTLAGNFSTIGAFTTAFTMTGNTTVTFPMSGTLATTSQIPTGAALTKVDDTNVTLTLGGSPSTALINAASLTLGWSGQLAVSRGGTGISAFGTGVATALGQNVSGSGGMALTTSPTFVTPILGAASATSITFSSTSGIIGTTTNNSAAAGSVGETITSSVTSPAGITTNTDTNVTSISLTAGDWLVSGNVSFTTASTTIVKSITGWISATSATLPATYEQISRQDYGTTGVSNAATLLFGLSVTPRRISVPSTTTIYLSGRADFTTSTMNMGGFITAVRMR